MNKMKHEDLRINRSALEQQLIPNTNIFFVHIPKNAGTTFMKEVLDRQIATHATADHINSIEDYKEHKNVLFCRDPLRRFVSVYLWRLRKDDIVQSLSLEEVVERLDSTHIIQATETGFETDPEKLNRMFLKQVTWMNENTEFVGRTENFKKDIKALHRLYGVEYPAYFRNALYPAPRHNMAKGRGDQPYPTRRKLIEILKQSAILRNKFFDYYADDYKTFGYQEPHEIQKR